MADLVQSMIAGSRVMVFSKSYCPYCAKAKAALQSVGLTQYGLLELDNHPRCDEVRCSSHNSPRAFVPPAARRPRARVAALTFAARRDSLLQVQDALLKLTGGRSVPRVFVDGKFIGGGDDTAAMARDGRLKAMLVSAGIMSAL